MKKRNPLSWIAVGMFIVTVTLITGNVFAGWRLDGNPRYVVMIMQIAAVVLYSLGYVSDRKLRADELRSANKTSGDDVQ